MAVDEFWKRIPLRDMSDAQWESLCDGCGRCCLHKLQDDYTGNVYFTSVACRLLDLERCRCRRYATRQQEVADCVVLDRHNLGALSWLPDTCAYRLLQAGQPLPDWHPLVSGSEDSVFRAGISVRGRVISEEGVHEDDLEDCVVRWIPATRYEAGEQ